MRGRKPNILINDIREQFRQEWFGKDDPKIWPLWVDDIVSGIARLDWYGDRANQIPLSTSNIIRCFVTLNEISTESVMKLLEIKQSQAKLYVKACFLCYRPLIKCLSDESILKTRYPQQSVVTEEQAILYGYHRQNRAFI